MRFGCALFLLWVLRCATATKDDHSFVQTNVYRHADDSCTCLPFSEAYKRGAKCGQGHEFDMVEDMRGDLVPRILPVYKFEFCEKLFANLPANESFCMKTKIGAGVESWCYVAESCGKGEDLQGPARPLKRKICDNEKDEFVGNAKFEVFANTVKRRKLELGLFVQYGYPLLSDVRLEDVQEFWGLPRGAQAEPLSGDTRALLQTVVDSSNTTFIPSRSGHPPFAVVEGKKFYWINFSESAKRGQALGEDVWAHKEDMNTWACVAGCPTNAPLW